MLIPATARANSVLDKRQVNAAFGALDSANESFLVVSRLKIGWRVLDAPYFAGDSP